MEERPEGTPENQVTQLLKGLAHVSDYQDVLQEIHVKRGELSKELGGAAGSLSSKRKSSMLKNECRATVSPG